MCDRKRDSEKEKERNGRREGKRKQSDHLELIITIIKAQRCDHLSETPERRRVKVAGGASKL